MAHADLEITPMSRPVAEEWLESYRLSRFDRTYYRPGTEFHSDRWLAAETVSAEDAGLSADDTHLRFRPVQMDSAVGALRLRVPFVDDVAFRYRLDDLVGGWWIGLPAEEAEPLPLSYDPLALYWTDKPTPAEQRERMEKGEFLSYPPNRRRVEWVKRQRALAA